MPNPLEDFHGRPSATSVSVINGFQAAATSVVAPEPFATLSLRLGNGTDATAIRERIITALADYDRRQDAKQNDIGPLHPTLSRARNAACKEHDLKQIQALAAQCISLEQQVAYVSASIAVLPSIRHEERADALIGSVFKFSYEKPSLVQALLEGVETAVSYLREHSKSHIATSLLRSTSSALSKSKKAIGLGVRYYSDLLHDLPKNEHRKEFAASFSSVIFPKIMGAEIFRDQRVANQMEREFSASIAARWKREHIIAPVVDVLTNYAAHDLSSARRMLFEFVANDSSFYYNRRLDQQSIAELLSATPSPLTRGYMGLLMCYPQEEWPRSTEHLYRIEAAWDTVKKGIEPTATGNSHPLYHLMQMPIMDSDLIRHITSLGFYDNFSPIPEGIARDVRIIKFLEDEPDVLAALLKDEQPSRFTTKPKNPEYQCLQLAGRHLQNICSSLLEACPFQAVSFGDIRRYLHSAEYHDPNLPKTDALGLFAKKLKDRAIFTGDVYKTLVSPFLAVLTEDLGREDTQISVRAKHNFSELYSNVEDTAFDALMTHWKSNNLPSVVKEFVEWQAENHGLANKEYIAKFGYDPTSPDVMDALLDLYRPCLPPALASVSSIGALAQKLGVATLGATRRPDVGSAEPLSHILT